MKRLTRVKSIRKKCLDCSDGQGDVKNCTFTDCQLYPFRMGRRAEKGTQAYKAIREYCTECSGDSAHERNLCPSKQCPLWIYRNGREEREAGNNIAE